MKRNMEENPFNLEKRIALIDSKGDYLYHIDQREAGHFLRSGQSELLLQYPPTVKLLIDSTELKPQRNKSGWLHSAKAVIYGNYRVQNPQGQEMFHCDATKVLWYLNRNLVDIVSNDPPAVRLKFAPNGNGHVDDSYYLTPKVNRCVCCGKEKLLNRHHVVPYCFRRFMPEEVKDHSYHDVLLLCLDCHEAYEYHASALKVELAERHGLKMHPTVHYDEDMGKAIKSAIALLRHGDKIPQNRKDFLYGQVEAYLKKKPVTEEDLLAMTDFDPWEREDEAEYGHQVLAFWNLQEFIEMWREHFVDVMKPQFMPDFWDMKKDCVRRVKSNEN